MTSELEAAVLSGLVVGALWFAITPLSMADTKNGAIGFVTGFVVYALIVMFKAA